MSRNKKNRKPAVKKRRISRILPVALAVVVSIAMFVWVLPALTGSDSGSSQQAAMLGGTLQAPVAFHDFGRISMQDGMVRHRFKVRNDSSAPARIEKLFTS